MHVPRTFIVQAVVRAVQTLDVGGHNVILVAGSLEIVAETAATCVKLRRRTVYCDLRLEVLSCTNSSDVRASCREGGGGTRWYSCRRC